MEVGELSMGVKWSAATGTLSSSSLGNGGWWESWRDAGEPDNSKCEASREIYMTVSGSRDNILRPHYPLFFSFAATGYSNRRRDWTR